MIEYVVVNQKVAWVICRLMSSYGFYKSTFSHSSLRNPSRGGLSLRNFQKTFSHFVNRQKWPDKTLESIALIGENNDKVKVCCNKSKSCMSHLSSSYGFYKSTFHKSTDLLIIVWNDLEAGTTHRWPRGMEELARKLGNLPVSSEK